MSVRVIKHVDTYYLMLCRVMIQIVTQVDMFTLWQVDMFTLWQVVPM